MITTEGIRATGLYLLEVLKVEKAVPYSLFYNRAPETAERLAEGALPFVEEADESYIEDFREEGHVMLDFAAWQLEDIGIVRITFLDHALMDAERDFRIELTAEGERVLAEGLTFRFRDHEDFKISAKPASEWLVNRLYDFHKDIGELTLREVMNDGHSIGAVVIHDDCGNEYHLGSRTYAWAFEVSLWHHAKVGHIEPACNTADQEKLWAAFVSQTNLPSRLDVRDPRPLWDILLRLADAVYAGQVQIQHVGNIG